jgi:hypothetical protein
MSPEPISPIVSGLTQAFHLANLLHSQRTQDRQLALEEQRINDQRTYQQGQEERQNSDLALRLQAGGYRSMTPSDELEEQTGKKYGLSGRLASRTATDADGLPMTQQTVVPQLTATDSDMKGRIVKVKGQKYVRPTDQEIEARQDRGVVRETAAEVAKKEALAKVGKIKLTVPPELQKLGLPETVDIDAAHLSQYVTSTGQEMPIDTGTAAALGAPGAKVPFKNLPSLVSSANAALGRRTQIDIAKDNREAANTRANTAETGRNTRATAANTSRETAAGIRRDSPTAGQAAVQGRFNQRELDARNRQMTAVQADEDKAHAERTRIGELLKDPNLKATDRASFTAKMKALRFQVQAYQSRKAGIVGGTAPPKAIQDQIPEGEQAEGPDGHTWTKRDGIVYFVK